MVMTRRRFLWLAGALPGYALVRPSVLGDPPGSPAFTLGQIRHVYDPSVNGAPWYINDHTFIQAGDGTWHMFGITHADPAAPLDEKYFAHATAKDLFGPWKTEAPVLNVDPQAGETLMWAPYVIRHEGLYYMYYCGGGEDHTKYRIDLATSKDLFNWERSKSNPMVIDGFDARDPMVLPVADTWIMYYCATSKPEGGNHVVKAVTSTDLLSWGNPQEVFQSPSTGTSGGPVESPFVVYREGKYYLFICGKNGYRSTACYVSDNPMHWDEKDEVGELPFHCAEIIHAPGDKWYASGGGWGNKGLDLVELSWKA